MKHYKIVLFGVKNTTREIAHYLFSQGIVVDLIVTVHPTVVSQVHISDYVDLSLVANHIQADCYQSRDYSLCSECIEEDFFQNNTFELGLVYGWQRIIPKIVLERFSLGVYGFHASPEKLPKGRGRSPMNWSLILGKTVLYNHFFRYSVDADRGDVYSITKFSINSHDNILTLTYKSLLCAQREIPHLLFDIRQKTVVLKAQRGKGYFFPKRQPQDGLIDFGTQRTVDIVNLIRGTSHPFPGAFCFNEKRSKITIWEAWSFDAWLDFSMYIPGIVISMLYEMPLIRTLDGSLLIKDYEGPKLCVGERLNNLPE